MGKSQNPQNSKSNSADSAAKPNLEVVIAGVRYSAQYRTFKTGSKGYHVGGTIDVNGTQHSFNVLLVERSK